jgi:hypothetical protein
MTLLTSSRLLRCAAMVLSVAAPLSLVETRPAQAQWDDGYEDVPRRRAREYYRDDGGYSARQANRRYAPPQEQQRQFYWPWEDRTQQAPPAPTPGARPTRPRSPAYADEPRSRRPRPAAPVAAQPKPAVPKAEPSIRIAVFGDSLASYLKSGLTDVFEDNADVAMIDRSRGDSGLVRRDVVDWPKAAEEFIKAGPKPAYAVVMLGANDRQAIREGDQSAEPLTERWREIYRGRVDALVKVFSEQKVPLIWVGAPPMRSESLTKDIAAINEIYRERVSRGGGTYVDVWPGFVDERNRFVVSGPDLEGQPAKLRTSDGVHFTKAGARKVAHFADVELKRLMGAGAPAPADAQAAPAVAATPAPTLEGSIPKLDDTAALDRHITAMLPSLPEPPGIPALPVKPAAGPVVPLSRPEVSPGGVLLSGRPGEPDPSGAVERTLQRGAPPPPQPGRADDFRWPPG